MVKQSHNSEQTPFLLVIGLGNQYRGDDAVGLVVAQRLKQRKLQNAKVLEHNGDDLALMELWKGAHMVILIDAAHSGAPPGTIFHFNPLKKQILQPVFTRSSTHSFSVADAIELARNLSELPSCVSVYGIEAKNFEPGNGLSAEVEAAVPEVIERVAKELESAHL